MRSAQILHIRSKELLALGRSLQIANAEAAAGRCLTTVLEFAAQARARRIEVELVKWQVHGDPTFADHWAVRLDADRVIDPTRVQVDGARRLVCAIDDYPANYRRRRCYPAAILLPAYRRLAFDERAPRVPHSFLVGCNLRLFGFDLACTLVGLQLADALAACAEFGRFALSSSATLARQRLAARALALEQRLQAIAAADGTLPIRRRRR